jgi:hypothetical protein
MSLMVRPIRGGVKRTARPALKALLLSAGARGEMNIPERGGRRRRASAKTA